MSIKYTQIGHPAILCNKFAETLEFYTKKLGFKEAFTLYHEDGSPWLTYVQIRTGEFVELFHTTYTSPNKTKERSYHHFCIEVDDMAATLARLQEHGIEVFNGPVDGGNKMTIPNPDHAPGMCGTLCAFIRDPEGNDIELQEYTEKSMQLQDFCKEDAATTNDNHVSRIAHVTMKCNDFEKMCAFYRDTMGLEPMFTLPYQGRILDAHTSEGFKEGDTWLAYFKVNDRHFIELFNEPYDTKYHIPQYSFMHFSIMVEDIVEAARHFEAKGLTLWGGPKHANNPYKEPYKGDKKGACGSYAFYIQDVEGNEIEVMQYTEDSIQLNWEKK